MFAAKAGAAVAQLFKHTQLLLLNSLLPYPGLNKVTFFSPPVRTTVGAYHCSEPRASLKKQANKQGTKPYIKTKHLSKFFFLTVHDSWHRKHTTDNKE